jgi:electron transfer flavoprotein beta subunit
MSMNPFDEIAVEEAVRLKEAGKATEIVAVSHRPGAGARKPSAPRWPWAPTAASCADRRRAAAAGGRQAAEGPWSTRNSPASSSSASRRSTTTANQTGQMLAALLGWPQAPSPRRSCRVAGDKATVTREVDGGLETIELKLPASSPPTCASTSRATLAAQHHEGEEEADRRP